MPSESWPPPLPWHLLKAQLVNDWAGPSTFSHLPWLQHSQEESGGVAGQSASALCYLGMLGESPHLSGCPFPTTRSVELYPFYR